MRDSAAQGTDHNGEIVRLDIVGVGCHGVGYHGVGCHGVGCHGVGYHGVGCHGVSCCRYYVMLPHPQLLVGCRRWLPTLVTVN